MFLFKSPVERHVDQLQREILGWLGEVWGEARPPHDLHMRPGWSIARNPEHHYHRSVTESVRRLQARFGAEQAGVMAADMLLNPALWNDPDAARRGDGWQTFCVLSALNATVCAAPPADFVRRLGERLRLMFEHPYDRLEKPSLGSIYYPTDNFYEPNVRSCLLLLPGLPPSAERLDLTRALLRGDMNRMVSTGPRIPPRPVYELYHVWEPFQELLADLFNLGQLDDDLLRACILHSPNVVNLPPRREWTIPPREGFQQRLNEVAVSLLQEVAQSLTPENFRVLTEVRVELTGSNFLLLAARHHSRLKLRKLPLDRLWDRGRLENAILRLAQASDVEPETEAERMQLIGQFKEVPASTLRALLPVASHGRALLCEALGWHDAIPLVELVAAMSRQTYETSSGQGRDIPNSPDPECGVVDIAAARRALDQAGERLAREVLKLLGSARADMNNTVTLIEAVAGWNRAALEAKIEKHNQIAIKAYGALPLLNGDDEVLERYLTIQRIAREGQKYGAQRRASHTAAAAAAATNLARVAGYADAGRLEWAMEARLAQSIAPGGRRWDVGDYALELVVEGAEARLTVERGGKTLKAVPREVRASAEYAEAKEAVSRLRAQVSRLRTGLIEGLIASGDMLTPDELRRLLVLPAARDMIQRLILQAEDGSLGLFDAGRFALVDLDGAAQPITGPVRVAHSYHLFQAGALAAWQRRVVHLRIVQPVKQAFRELYLLTPAELETRTYSNRFAGHSVDMRVANRLFTARGWRLQSGDIVLPYKVFPGLRAVFELPDAYYYLGGAEPATTDRIYFQPYPLPDGYWRKPDESRLPLDAIPPLIFSEVMRDADLVVSVAQRTGEALLSNEAYQRRGELVKAILDDLGLPGVTVEGHFARVQGKLARYRVHLGSAAIHIEPGNYLCIVPARSSETNKRLFLPFADADDAKTSEVISKILLLVNDHQIKDESILRQIRRQA